MRLTNYLRNCFVAAVFADIPQPKAPTNNEVQDALYDAFDPLVKAVYDNEQLRKGLCQEFRYCSRIGGRYLTVANLKIDALKIVKTYNDAVTAHTNARCELGAVAAGCKNLKQLQDTLPELVKYMVLESKPTPVNLPAITGTIDTLKALGWTQ